jgi:hypothetical protein
MSRNYLHVAAGTRYTNTSVIVGDHAALGKLRDAIEQALATGSGGARLSSSDGEDHRVAVVFENNMYPVYTSYAFEATPVRSRRETIPIDQLRNYADALKKAAAAIASKPSKSPTLAASGSIRRTAS